MSCQPSWDNFKNSMALWWSCCGWDFDWIGFAIEAGNPDLCNVALELGIGIGLGLGLRSARIRARASAAAMAIVRATNITYLCCDLCQHFLGIKVRVRVRVRVRDRVRGALLPDLTL